MIERILHTIALPENYPNTLGLSEWLSSRHVDFEFDYEVSSEVSQPRCIRSSTPESYRLYRLDGSNVAHSISIDGVAQSILTFRDLK